jgi:hypothetical protein
LIVLIKLGEEYINTAAFSLVVHKQCFCWSSHNTCKGKVNKWTCAQWPSLMHTAVLC